MKKVLIQFVLYLALLSTVIYAKTPEMVYSTFIGSSGWEFGHAIAVDSHGYVYISGQAQSQSYPTTDNAFDKTFNGEADIFVSKLNQDGSGLEYSTFIGGYQWDSARNIFVDESGCVYLTGGPPSSDFPVTENAFPGNGGGYFLKLNANGSALVYSTIRLGGDKIIADGEGNVIIVTSYSTSNNFPITENAYCQTPAGGEDILVVKLDLETNEIIFSTLLGGSSDESGVDLAIDKSNNIIVVGMTKSEDFPVTGNTFGSYNPDKSDIFITKFNPDGTDIIFSTLIGGSDEDTFWGFAVDGDDNVYVTGRTISPDFPTTDNAVNKSSSLRDGYLAKLSSDGTQLIYSTYIGGSGGDECRGVAVDSEGKVYLTGCTNSDDFPITDDAYAKSFQGGGSDWWSWGDAFLLVMNSASDEIEYATYLGGRDDDEAYGIAYNDSDICLCGTTPSSNFLTTANAYDRSFNGGCDVYVTKFSYNNTSDVKLQNNLPLEFQLHQNYPNPFNPSTCIRYTLGKPSQVKLSVYNMLGQKIKTLVNSYQNSGEHSITWDGTDESNNPVSTGIYIYQMKTNNQILQKKMLLIR